MNVDQYTPQLTSLFDASDVVLAYLFGSEAKGTANRESDIDIAVLLSDQIPQAEYGQRVVDLNTELIGIFQRDAIDVALLNTAPPLSSMTHIIGMSHSTLTHSINTPILNLCVTANGITTSKDRVPNPDAPETSLIN